MRNRVISLLLTIFIFGCSIAAIDDPKIHNRKFSDEDNQIIHTKVNSLVGQEKECLNIFINDYQKSLYEYCEATDGGDDIGGGCNHVAYAWSITSSVLEAGLSSCQKNT